jgi:hypothetical protein
VCLVGRLDNPAYDLLKRLDATSTSLAKPLCLRRMRLRTLPETATIAGKRVYAQRCGKLKLGGIARGADERG